ncbi:MAG: M42 family metallopeptidase [Candidatus Acetothermia bacterium]|jgi:endoglucanase|nr:M42 family metallopeptidase [Candidatus Acetothermia bacterium]
MELLKRLSEAVGVPGHEEGIRALVKEELEGLVDELRTDVLGNVIGLKRGKGQKRVMLAAHMDEIGFLVKHIEKEGFLRIEPLGGFDPRVLLAERVLVHTRGGDLPGVVGSKPIHILTEEERKKPVEIKELFIDLGLPAEEVKKAVRIGDSVTLRQEFTQFGEVVSGKALDDRVGLYVIIEALRRVKRHRCDVYLVATTQEEVGLRGAHVSGFGISPDIAIAVDVTLACDVPGVSEAEQITRLGQGTAIKLKDAASISNPRLVRRLVDLAEEKGIKYQLEILPRGGTDAGALQLTKEGVAAATVSVPTRNVHTVVEVAHKGDIEASIALLAAFLEVAHEGDYTL